MNSINFFNDKKKFPLSTQVLEFLQNMIKEAHLSALIGGSDKYILTGCEKISGNTWSEGYVVVNGETLKFTGGVGAVDSLVRVKETKADIVAGYDTYKDALIVRILEFGSNIGNSNTYIWSEFTRLKSNAEIATQYATKDELVVLGNLLKPVGDITIYPNANTLPIGHMLCDGAELNREEYPALFAVIGTQFGSTSELKFKLPDMRNRFVVGYNSTSLNFPKDVTDQKVENYGVIGNKGGKPLVQLSGSESGTAAHSHNVKGYINNGSGYKVLVQDSRNTNESETIIGNTDSAVAASASEGHENRPPYIVMAYIIKVV